MGQELESIDY